MDAKEFGAKLKEIRKEKKLTLLDLKARTGYSDSYLSQIENGYKPLPKRDLLRTLAVGLDISPIHLFNLAGYSYSYIDVENGTVKLENKDHQLKDEMFLKKEKKIEVNLPCVEKIEMENEEQTIKELSDDELRRRLFDLHDFLDMDINLYYKNEFLTNEKRTKIRTMLELILE